MKLVYWLHRVSLESLADFWIHAGKLIATNYMWHWQNFDRSWYDHRFDFLGGPNYWFWAERGVLAYQLCKDGANVLDLCCGDGIYAGLFYSQRANHVDAIDRNGAAIALAKKKYQRENVTFICDDILKHKLASNKYDLATLFVAIEHFKPEDGQRLLKKIKKSLKDDGVLIGSTPIFKELGGHNDEHANEFTSHEMLYRFLRKNFRRVNLTTSQWKRRTEYYFYCSNK